MYYQVSKELLFFVHVVYCQSIPGINNGTITCSQSNTGIYFYQDMCNFACNSGYTLNGSDTRMCLSNGSWSGIDVVCMKSKGKDCTIH